MARTFADSGHASPICAFQLCTSIPAVCPGTSFAHYRGMKSFRFYPYRIRFAHCLSVPPRLAQEAAMALVREQQWNFIIEGHIWLAVDLVERYLSAFRLPSYLGEEALAEAVTKLTQAVRKLNRSHNNIAAYLSRAIENRLMELSDCLVYVPRKRRATESPAIIFEPKKRDKDGQVFAWEEWLAAREDTTAYLWRVIRRACFDSVDKRLVKLRYDGGAGPRNLGECAVMLNVSVYEAASRLDEIETRVYCELEKRKPDVRRKHRRC
jgi:hypothetical protein